MLVVAGCGGGHSSSTRDKVSAYIGRVNVVQSKMQQPLLEIHQAILDFAKHAKPAPAELAHADTTLERLDTRLAAADPPPQAHKLQQLMQRLIAHEETLVVELRQLTLFEPRFTNAMKPLATANAATEKSLVGLKKPAAVAAVLGSYRSTVESTLANVVKLRPPLVERPLFTAQVGRLRALDTSLGSLVAAVVHHDATASARAQHAVSEASVSSDSRANQLAQRAAVQAYDRSVRQVGQLGAQIAAERNRLQVHLQ